MDTGNGNEMTKKTCLIPMMELFFHSMHDTESADFPLN